MLLGTSCCLFPLLLLRLDDTGSCEIVVALVVGSVVEMHCFLSQLGIFWIPKFHVSFERACDFGWLGVIHK